MNVPFSVPNVPIGSKNGTKNRDILARERDMSRCPVSLSVSRFGCPDVPIDSKQSVGEAT